MTMSLTLLNDLKIICSNLIKCVFGLHFTSLKREVNLLLNFKAKDCEASVTFANHS